MAALELTNSGGISSMLYISVDFFKESWFLHSPQQVLTLSNDYGAALIVRISIICGIFPS